MEATRRITERNVDRLIYEVRNSQQPSDFFVGALFDLKDPEAKHDFSGLDLISTRWNGVVGRSNFKRANLRGSQWANLGVFSCTFEGADMSQSSLKSNSMDGMITDCDFRRVRFDGAHLVGDFRDCRWEDCVLSGSNFRAICGWGTGIFTVQLPGNSPIAFVRCGEKVRVATDGEWLEVSMWINWLTRRTPAKEMVTFHKLAFLAETILLKGAP